MSQLVQLRMCYFGAVGALTNTAPIVVLLDIM